MVVSRVSHFRPCCVDQLSGMVQEPSPARALQPSERVSSYTEMLVSACVTVLFHT